MKRVNSNDNDNSNVNILRENFRETETASLFRLNSSRKDVNSFLNVKTADSRDNFFNSIFVSKNILDTNVKQIVDTQENENKSVNKIQKEMEKKYIFDVEECNNDVIDEKNVNKNNQDDNVISKFALNNLNDDEKKIDDEKLIKRDSDNLLFPSYENGEITTINLPKKIPYRFSTRFNPKSDLEHSIFNHVISKLYMWDVEDRSFKFELPPSLFNENTQVNYYSYKEEQVQYAEPLNITEERNLSSQQLSDIFYNSQFKVESTIPGLPYEWYITHWIIKGYNTIYTDFLAAVGVSFFLIFKLKYRFIFTEGFGFSFQDSFWALPTAVKEFFAAVIGIPKFKKIRNVNKIISDLKKEFVQEFVRENENFTFEIFQKNVQAQINIMCKVFEQFWIEELPNIEQKLYEGRSTSDEVKHKLYLTRIEKILEFIDNIEDSKFSNLIDSTILTPKIKEIIKMYFISHNIVDRNFLLENSKIVILKKEVENEVVSLFDVRSKVKEWKHNQINNILGQRILHIKNETEELIKSEMKENEITEPLKLFTKIISYDKIYKEIFEESLENTYENAPTLNFEIPFMYTTIVGSKLKVRNDGSQFYVIDDAYYYSFSNNFYFWKFPLFLFRYFSFTWNIYIYSYKMIFNHSLGISSFYETEVNHDYKCDSQTGVIEKINPVGTLRSSLSKLCNSITENRKEFEDSPDDSFFGKNCSRIFNLIYNYLIKTFVAFFVFILGYPIVILLWSIMWFIILCTCYVWGLLGIIFYSLISVLIVDIESTFVEEFNLGLIPIIFYTILIKFIFQLIATILLLIFQPILAILIVAFGIIRMILRFMYDIFMFAIIYIFAKVPVSDSFLAWKISGPGLTRKYYNSMDVGEALTLIHAHLEAYELLTFKNKINKLIEKPLNENFNELSKYFYMMDLKLYVNSEMVNNIDYYKSLLSKQISKRMKLYPKVSNIKFNDEELTILKISSREYIREYITSHQMNYIFTSHSIQVGAWGKLNEVILKEVFGDQILESLTDLDYKIEIRREENIHFDGIKIEINEKSKIQNIKDFKADPKFKEIEMNNIKLSDITNNLCNRKLYLDIESSEEQMNEDNVLYERDRPLNLSRSISIVN